MAEESTWKISQLTDWLNAVVSTSLGGEIWVEGEISNLQRSNAGHVYFTLVERSEDDVDRARTSPATLAVTLFEWHKTNVNRHLKRTGGNVRMGDGVRVRIRGTVEIYAVRSQLQLKMTGIDPVFTLGSMAAERARLLAALRAEGLLDAQRELDVPALPLRIALVTSIGSAAHADALDELVRSGVGFDVSVIDARVQGTDAPASIINALGEAELLDPDVILVVRGGGARTDLVAFDDEEVARTIATSPVPIWVGLGHETDRTVVDDVAQRSFKTPTAAAAAVVTAIADAQAALDETWERVLDTASNALRTARSRLALSVSLVGSRTEADLRRADRRVVSASVRLAGRAPAIVHSAQQRLVDLDTSLAALAAESLDDASDALDRIEGLVRAYDPQTTLARGWSITRLTSGELATAATLTPGDIVITTLADGTISSTVSSKGPNS